MTKNKRQIGLVPIWYPHIYEAANGKNKSVGTVLTEYF
jgi:hypothetical protein